MNFFFIREAELTSDDEALVVCDDRLDRLKLSMDIHAGTEFRIAVENRGRGIAKVASLTASEMSLVYGISDCLSDAISIDVMLALPRPKVVGRLIPRLVSMGISSLTLINAAGVKKEYFSTHWLGLDKIQALAIAAIEQSGVFKRPEICIQKELRPFLEDNRGCCVDGNRRLLFEPGDIRTQYTGSNSDAVTLAIGPETGWTDFEKKLFLESEFSLFSMGPEHLASDVAAIAAVAAVKAMCS